MKIYTKQGDEGVTSLLNGVRVSKTDDRIELIGEIDELNAMIGLAKVQIGENEKEKLSSIQQELMKIMAGIADPQNAEYRVKEDMLSYMEEEIDKTEASFEREKKFVLYGNCESSARLDIARAVTRKVERQFFKTSMNYKIDNQALKYINRLSDYLYIMARYEDSKNSVKQNKK